MNCPLFSTSTPVFITMACAPLCMVCDLVNMGLPLMGSGDWNDGMNLVGIHGRGESVWLGFFLYTVLKNFAVLARRYGDGIFASAVSRE